MKHFLSLTISFVLLGNISFAQNNDSQAFLYNVGSNAIIGGIGALLNKKKDEKFHKVLFKGLGQGALGGYLVFESKRMIRNFSRTKEYSLLWPSKILNHAGNSITLNAAENRNFWERWHLNIGFNHIEYDIKRKRRWRYRVMPFSLYGAIAFSFEGELDFKKTMYSGNFIFKTDQIVEYGAKTLAGNIIYDLRDLEGVVEMGLGHEIIHIYQYEGWVGFRAYFDRPNTLISNDGKIINIYNKIFYSDWNYLIQNVKVAGERIFTDSYYQIFTEQEAFYWTDDFRNPLNQN